MKTKVKSKPVVDKPVLSVGQAMVAAKSHTARLKELVKVIEGEQKVLECSYHLGNNIFKLISRRLESNADSPDIAIVTAARFIEYESRMKDAFGDCYKGYEEKVVARVKRDMHELGIAVEFGMSCEDDTEDAPELIISISIIAEGESK